LNTLLSLAIARFDQLKTAVELDGYTVQQHEVQTKDGWKLNIMHL
jgi:Partial alpha/beta-hydrolase lipase region